MVYQGPSRACARCKQRHIKCDETRPACRNCLKRQLECPGYAPEPGIRFQDETSSTIHQAQQREQRRPTRKSTAKETPAITPSLTEDTETAALNFFFDNYAVLGRGSQSSLGFFEYIKPIHSSAAPASAMSAATLAVALTLTSEWHGKTNDARPARKHINTAIRQLRKSLNDPVLSLTDDTMMATLLLQYHDTLVACQDQKEIPDKHLNGAIAMVKHRFEELGLSSFESVTSKRLLQHVRHVIVAHALQQGVKVDIQSVVWTIPFGSLQTPSIDLDWIGIEVANLRASAEVQWLLQERPTTTRLDEKQTRDIRFVRAQAERLDMRLVAWADGRSGYWRSTPLSNILDMDESIRNAGLYGTEYHLYPSAQVAHIWNQHREYCLLILELHLRCEVHLDPESSKRHMSLHATLFRNIVDDLCASVPFLLGNRTKPSSMEDFNLTTGTKFLEHPDDDKFNIDSLEMDLFMNEQQRMRSLLAQGPSQLHDYFAYVLQFANSEVGLVLAPLLPPSQMVWMQGQVQRILKLQRIDKKGKGPELRSRRSHTDIDAGVGGGSDPARARKASEDAEEGVQ